MSALGRFRTFCRNSLAAQDVDPGVAWLRYIVKRMEMNREQVLWLCLLYGITYHLPSAYLIWSEFPDLEILDPERLRAFWAAEQQGIPFQTDKMKQRRSLPDTVESYRALVGQSQVDYFAHLLTADDPQENFQRLWSPSNGIAYFGRFSIWNWAQMLKHVADLPIDPPSLLLGEPDSRSFTDGLAHAFGTPERAAKGYQWAEEEKRRMESDCAGLRAELGIDNFELETLACAYKKVWRDHDSRYVGYYTDRLTEDLRRVETNPRWVGVDWGLLWDARAACTPSEYRNPGVDKRLFTATVDVKTGAGHMKTRRTQSLYIVGGAGTGKSTFMDALVGELGAEFGPYGPLYTGAEASTGRSRTLCGHRLDLAGQPEAGVYVGQHRGWFPGTDGLDLVISPTAAEWLRVGTLPHFLMAEGAVLATPKFLGALREETNMLLLHLAAPAELVTERVEQRGSADRHVPSFLLRTVTRAANVRASMRKAGVTVLSIDTSDPEQWELALDLCVTHLL